MQRKQFITGLLASAVFPSWAQATWPTAPIKIIQGFPPGGNIDTVARLIGAELSRTLGQPVVVESRPGAGGNIASDAVAKAPADGYTLLLMSGSHPANAAIAKSLPFHPVDSFAMISTLATYPFVVLVRADSPYKTLGELLSAARAKPDSLAFGSTGIGSIYQLVSENLAKQAGAKFLHVPYKGEAPIMLGLLGGEIPFTLATPTLALANIKSGKVRPLAVTGDKRWRFLPEVPTVSEAGVAGYAAESWLALATTAGTPAAIVQRLNDEVKRALENPEVRARIDQLGSDPAYSTTDGMRKRVTDDVARFRQIVRAAGIEPQ
jgi:tripartite-type tricarboxylate transporter receptor subunit TctC